jgi:hypothetical protein
VIEKIKKVKGRNKKEEKKGATMKLRKENERSEKGARKE